METLFIILKETDLRKVNFANTKRIDRLPMFRNLDYRDYTINNNSFKQHTYYSNGTKPSWCNIGNTLENLLMTEPYLIANEYNPQLEKKDIFDLKDSVLCVCSFDNGYGGSNLDVYEIGSYDTLDEINKIMDILDPYRDVEISLSSRYSLVFSTLFSDKVSERHFRTNSPYGGYGYSMDKLYKGEVLDNDVRLNIDNYINNVLNTNYALQYFVNLIAMIPNEDDIIELSKRYYSKAINSGGRGSLITIGENSNISDTTITKISNILKNGILSGTDNRHLLLDILGKDFVSNRIDEYFDYIIGAKYYSCYIIDVLMENKNTIDLTKVNKNKFVKQTSLQKYNELLGVECDAKVLAMADLINSAGTVIYERLYTLTCFMNAYSEDELHSVDFSPIADALLGKLIAKHRWELSTANINLLMQGDTDNMQYLCDLVIERLCESSLNSVSRVNFIKENCNKKNHSSNTITLLDLLNNSVENSNHNKIIRALLKASV